MKAKVFEKMADDLPKLLRLLPEREHQPTGAILDARTLQTMAESGGRAGCDGYKRKRVSKIHVAVDTSGHLPSVKVTPANERERDQLGDLSAQVHEATGENVQVAFVDQGHTGEQAADEAAGYGVKPLCCQVVRSQEGLRFASPKAGG